MKVRPGTSHKEHADMAPKSSEKIKDSLKSTVEIGKSSLRGKKSSICYNSS